MSIAIAALAALSFAVTAGAVAEPPTLTDCADCPKMIVIPAGSATLGSTAEERRLAGIIPIFGDREEPTYRVTFAQPYAIGRTEITRGQYRAFVEATGRADPPACGNHEPKKDFWGPRPGYNWRKPGFEQTDDHPAVCIGYDDAVAYAQWLSAKTGKAYRLPSDAEWEYAARAGTSTPWYWGDRGEDGCGIANLMSTGTVARLGYPNSMANRFACSSARAFTVPVASFPPNAFGVYDMMGNAFEWAADCNSPDNRDAHADGSARTTGDCARHYLKGGAFQTPFWLTRSAVRGAPLAGDIRMFAMGFRVARSLDPLERTAR
jgi:formylglycine-generating enzyme